jgi:hypothetical protein
MPDVFISYSQIDRKAAEILANYLQDQGFKVWWDYNIDGGEDYRTAIVKNLAESKAVIVIWSSHSVVSPFVLDEASRALQENKLVLTHVSGFDLKLLPLGFGPKHCVDVEDRELIVRALKNRTLMGNSASGPKMVSPREQGGESAPSNMRGIILTGGAVAIGICLISSAYVFGFKAEVMLPNGKYTATRGYNLQRSDDCKSEYKFNVAVKDGKINFESDGRYYDGEVNQKSGYIEAIDGRNAHPPTKTAFLVKGNYSNAKMTSDFCGQGYFRIDK